MKPLLYISLIFLLLLLLPSAPSYGQVVCNSYSATDPEPDAYWSLHFGAPYGSDNYVAGDFYGYSVLYAGGQGTVVVDAAPGGVQISSSSSFNHLVTVHTNGLGVYKVGGTFDAQICTPVGGTPTFTPTITFTPSNTPTPTITLTPSNTPTPTITLTPSNTPTATAVPTDTPFPTSSPTLTPTEVLVTATFTPTPTIDNVAVLVERTNQSFQFNVFLAIPLLGILLLLLLRRR